MKFQSSELNWGDTNRETLYCTMKDLDDKVNAKNYEHPLAPNGYNPVGSVGDFYETLSNGQLRLKFEFLPAGLNHNPNSENPDDYAHLEPDDYQKSGYNGSTKIPFAFKYVVDSG